MEVSEFQESNMGASRALEAPEFSQCHFHHVLLVKAIHRPAQIEEVEKQIPSGFDEKNSYREGQKEMEFTEIHWEPLL